MKILPSKIAGILLVITSSSIAFAASTAPITSTAAPAQTVTAIPGLDIVAKCLNCTKKQPQIRGIQTADGGFTFVGLTLGSKYGVYVGPQSVPMYSWVATTPKIHGKLSILLGAPGQASYIAPATTPAAAIIAPTAPVLTASTVTPSTSAAPGGPSNLITTTTQHDVRALTVGPNDTFIVQLQKSGSNDWQLESSDKGTVDAIDTQSSPNPDGKTSNRSWKLKAFKAGSVKLTFKYAPSWSLYTSPSNTFTLNVTVRAGAQPQSVKSNHRYGLPAF